MKKLFLLFATLLGSVGVSAYDFEVNGIYYTITSYDNHEVCIDGYADYQELTFPNKEIWVDDKYESFEGVLDLSEPVYDNNSTEWWIKSVSSLSNCKSIKSVYLSSASVEYGAFRYCINLQKVVGDNVSISGQAFEGCTSLKTVSFFGVTGFGTDVFCGCPNLESIKIKTCQSNGAYYTEIGYYGYFTPEGSNAVIRGKAKKSDGSDFVPEDLYAGCKTTIIPDGVKTIKYRAFAGCSSLASISIPSSVTSIESYAFYGCTGLSGIVVEAGNTKYDSRNNCNAIIETSSNTLLYGCKNTVIPNDVTSIYESAFSGCSDLTTLVIPSSVTSIGQYAFSGCSGLVSINIPSSVASIGNSAYSGCVNLSSISVESGNTTYDSRNDCNALIETNSNTLLYGCKETVVPNTVTSIAAKAFYGCSGLTSLSIPTNVTSIGTSAFENCANLAAVSLPSSLTTIGSNAFKGCTSLNAVTLPNSVTSIGDNAFYECSGLQTLTIATSNVGSWFRDNKSLTTVTLTENVTSIGEYAFSRCTNLASINIPSSITSIGANAFYGCISLPSITMGNTIPTAGNGFLDVTTMVVYVPSEKVSDYKTAEGWSNYASSILAIGTQTIYDINVTAKNDDSDIHSVIGETNLKNVSELTLTGSINSYDVMIMRDKMPNLRKLDLTNANIVANSYEYMNGHHTENDAFLYGMRPSSVRELKLPLSLKKIGSSAFYYESSLKELIIPNGVEEIGNEAFRGCNLITNIPKSVVTIGNEAFRNCNGLMELDFSNSAISTIGNGAFSECKNLQEVDFSNSDINIIGSNTNNYGNYGAFAYCTSLSSLNLSNCANLAIIGDCTFRDNTSLVSANMSNSKIGTIGSSAFAGCIALESVDLENSEVNVIGNSAFSSYQRTGSYYYNSYENEDLGYRLKTFQTLKLSGAKIGSIYSYAFYDCNQLDIDFSDADITSIGNNAFLKTAIKEVDLSNSSIKNIGQYAFQYCSTLKEVNLSNTKTTSINQGAFYGCNSLESVNLSNCQNLTSIESSAFYNCNKLEEIQIPGSVKTIGNSAFNCNSITDVYAKTIIPRTITINTFSNNTMKNGTLHVPALSYKNYYWATNWSQFATIVEDANPDYFFIDDDLTVESGKATGDAVDADINTVGGMVVEDDNQAFNEVSIVSNGTTSGSFIPSNNTTINIINLNITVTANKWQFLSFPYRVKLTDVVAPGFYVFRRYDGQQRANTGGTGWASLAQETEYLEPGVGYIFQSSQSGTLGIRTENPDLSWGSGKTNPLSVYTTDNIQHASWNFVGNPMLCYYDIDDLHTTAPLTFWNGSSYVARRPGDDNYQMKPFEAFFLQKPNDVEALVYEKSGRMTYKQAQEHHNNKNAARAEGRSERYLINLSLVQDGQTTDETRVVYNNTKSMVYEPDCDAAKFMSIDVNMPQLYSLQGNDRMAINERPEGEVQLGFTAAKAGELTLSAERMDTKVLLRDNLTGTTHRLAEGAYTFTTEAGTFNDRFTLVPEAETTGINALNEKGALDPRSLATNGTQEMINDKLYDLQGRRTTDAAQKGVRIVRKNHETRKIVK